MQIQVINIHEAEALCLKSENHFFDRKSSLLKPGSVERHVVAFANADGGEIIIGIEDQVDSSHAVKSWDGKLTVEDYNPYVQCIMNLSPSIPAAFKFYASPGLPGIILSIQVEKSLYVHKASDGMIYVRRNASSMVLKDQDKIRELEYAKGIVSFEEEKVPNLEIDDVESSKALKNFLNGFSPRTESLDYLINEYLLDRKTWEPKYAGVLLFHDSPASILSRKTSVRITRYETREDDPERDHLKSSESIEGSLYDLIQNSINRINQMLTDVNIWSMEGIKKVNYPTEAIWELFVNAIIHRDYSVSDDVQVYIFDNRIEIKSPGKLPGGITPENILSERFTRNTKIVRTLSRYKNAPNKDIGEGINTAFQKMRDWKLQSPSISEEGNYVIVTIPHTPLARPEELVMEFLEGHSEITNKQARDLTGIKDTNNMKAVFYRLKDAEKIEPVPERKGSSSAWRKKTN